MGCQESVLVVGSPDLAKGERRHSGAHAPRSVATPTLRPVRLSLPSLLHPPSPKHGSPPYNMYQARKSYEEEETATVEQHYTFHNLIGKGQFGFVYRATDRRTNIEYAIKKIDRRRSKPEYVEAEIYILCRIGSHPNVISLYEAYQTVDNIFLVLELMKGGELFDLLRRTPYSEADARTAVLGLTNAVAYMHAHGIVHRDLKPENLLLSEKSTKGVVKLSDFGLSKLLQPGEQLTAVCGTWAYSAPEMRLPYRPGYSFQVDMWSLGLLVFIMMGGYHPFDVTGHGGKTAVLAAMQAGTFEFDDPVWRNISEPAKDLIRRLLVVDPAGRLTAPQALQHAWFSMPVVSDVPIANTEQMSAFSVAMRVKLRASMFATQAGMRMRAAVATRRRRRFSDPLQDGGALVPDVSSPPAARDARAPVVAVVVGSTPGPGAPLLPVHPGAPLPPQPRMFVSKSDGQRSVAARRRLQLHPARARLDLRRQQSEGAEALDAERRLFSHVSREFSYGSGAGSSGEGPDITRALEAAIADVATPARRALALSMLPFSGSQAAAAPGSTAAATRSVGGRSGGRARAILDRVMSNASALAFRSTLDSGMLASFSTLGSTQRSGGGHVHSGIIAADTPMAAAIEAMLLPPQRRALLRRRARDVIERALKASRSRRRSVATDGGGGGGGGARRRGDPLLERGEAAFIARSAHVTADAVKSATAAYDASVVGGGAPLLLGAGKLGGLVDSSTRSLPATSTATSTEFAAAGAARLMTSIQRASTEHRIPGLLGPSLPAIDASASFRMSGADYAVSSDRDTVREVDYEEDEEEVARAVGAGAATAAAAAAAGGPVVAVEANASPKSSTPLRSATL